MRHYTKNLKKRKITMKKNKKNKSKKRVVCSFLEIDT